MSEPDQHLATDFCKSSVVPNHASESYYGYKGSYFTYPLRYHDGPKPLTHWTPPEAYPHCVAGTASHQLQTETALCMLYKQEAESFVARGQTLGHEKSGECASRNAFNAQERWAGYMGYPGYIPQGWIHSYMAQQSPRAPLAMPKPIYQHHVYNTESGYSLKSSLDLGMVTESALKPLEWALPPSGHLNCTENSGYDTSVSKKAAVAEASFPQLSPRPKDAAMSPGGFSPYRRSFEKCQTGQTASFLEGSYSSMCNSQKHISEMHGNSFGKHSWSKLPPPAGPLAHPPSLMYQDRSCYPLTSYPLLSQEQMYLYHPSYAQAERPNSLPACKRFDSPGTDESPIHPGSYISPTPRSYHPIPMESYPYKRTGTPMTPPGTLLSKEQEHQPRSIAKVAQKSPLPVCAQPHGASREWHKDRGTPEQAKENFPSQQPASQSGTLQKFHSLNRSPGLFGDFAQIQETNSRESFCPSEKAKTREKELSQVPKPSSFSCDAKKKGVDTHKIESGACIIISDSPGTPNNSCCKTTQQALDVQEVLTPSLHNGPQSPQGREKSVIKGPEIPQLPPSPPMPVINNVFSLAPYRDYLEVTSPKDMDKKTNRKELSNSCIKRENGDVLDLSCKTETLADNVSHPKGSSKSNGAEVGIVSSNGREVLPETNRPASELPVQSSSEKRGNFQSSATFLFKKFKIRRSPATEVGSIVQQTPSLSPTSQIAAPPRQGVTQQSISPVQDVTQQSCLQVATQPETMQRLQLQCINIQLPDMSKVLLPSTTAVSPVLGTANISPPASDKPPEQQSSPGQYFTDLHSSVCTVISCSVSASSPEQLKEWLEKGKQVWLAFKDVVALFRKLLSQLDTFLLTHKCPFPHVVRAGAIFIPIHVVKEKLFPNLPGTSVDHVLQNHKVELRPTTLSEEKLLRDLELKSCTSRMLKLLALKQLPDIYPDLLTLHWHNCVKQQLGNLETPNPKSPQIKNCCVSRPESPRGDGGG
uniref:Chromosome 15 open reading frame 39 n=1 Tax=Anolis carolinensis TaxID=28377 RepID=A0A803SWU0_ANOCA